MNETPHTSRAWLFIIATIILLTLFLINAFAFIGNSRASNPASSGALLSFSLAGLAILSGIAANASAFLNPASPYITKIVSPIIILLVAFIVIPFLVSLGLTMTG